MEQQQLDSAIAEIWELFKETDAKFKETDARLDTILSATSAEVEKTAQQIRALEGLFGSQWGRMLEALVQPGALAVFQARGIDVHYIYPRAKSHQNGSTMEIDLILENDTEIVVVETKSTLKVSTVDEFLADLDEFPRYFPKYANHRLYGAVAGLNVVEEADRYAYRRGLYVIGVSGEGVIQIRNDTKFRPRDFGISNPSP
ncbi:DUF3782 domain-containing protein [Chloroflexi bacterium TSY]|nr:DUF3782 domain-containing protein [Chloroflexi bacterium TSY]